MESGSAASARRRAALAERGREAHAAAVGLLWELGVFDRDDYADEVGQPPSPELRTLDGQLAILGGIMRECLVDPDRVARPKEVADVSQVLHEIHAVRFGIHDHLGHERLRRLDRLDQGLGTLRRMTDQDQLLETVCEAAADAGGFERVMLSRVDGDTWRPWRSWASSMGEAELAFRDWIRAVPTIELSQMLLESELVQRREPAIVLRAADDPRVYEPMARASGLVSYVAAPILSGDRVIGLLHADNQGTEMVDLDRDILWFFAIGFAQIFERAVLLGRLREQRVQVMEAMRSVEAVLDELATSTIDLVTRDEATAVGVSRPVRPVVEVERPRVLEEVLTGRELEVLALMATGATNERIAQRLVIATGTVKSHVKQILRKLRVENRAEAISQYLRLTIGARED
ncbi:LuxR C-terminal-related transcriptional regulator [Nocardioides humi]|uniref:HTH luxR-type domain-containing protein n=1 Tax=Nocardioides humi TaxID=449461 RepID=A0ABN2AYC5_9ACTN|nr:LuxR C-terminal-related transcriptional regulator [Nocardioides humi]